MADSAAVTPATITEPQPLLRLRNLKKTFPGTIALKGIDLDIRPGEIHGLVGQNGSGKSTVVKVLAGYHEPDGGAEGWLSGEEFQLGSVSEAARVGMRFVHQDLAIVLELDAIDNIALGGGYAAGRAGTIHWAEQRAFTARQLARFGVELDMRAPLNEASQVERTAVAIVRALAGWEGKRSLLVLDEPTAALPAPEVKRLHKLVHDVCRDEDGGRNDTSVLYVSHRLDEIFEIADRVSVLREGELVGTYDVADLTPRRLAELMVGREVHQPATRANAEVATAAPVLTARGLTGRWLRGIDLELRPGEAVGVAGVLGSGRDELPYALTSATAEPIEGTIMVGDRELPSCRPSAAHELGIGFVPADRGREAVVASFSMGENLTIGGMGRLARMGIVQARNERALIQHWIKELGIVPNDPERPISKFSGGNQQKVMVARWLSVVPKILVLSEPTAGVDIGAREAIYELLRAQLKSGQLGILVASSDVEDLVRLCDRVLVLRDGKVTRELGAGEVNATSILHAMEGTEGQRDAALDAALAMEA